MRLQLCDNAEPAEHCREHKRRHAAAIVRINVRPELDQQWDDFLKTLERRSAQLETVQSLVRAGMGISLVPAMAAQSERNDLPEYRSLKNPRPQRTIVAVWPRQRPPTRAAAEFLKVVALEFGK